MEDRKDRPSQKKVSEQGRKEKVKAGESVTIPVIEEQLNIDKEIVETGKVRISKTVQEEQKTVDLHTVEDELDVERVAVNKQIDRAPAIRHEGDTMIIPVLREVEVVEKKLLLVEELHVTRRQVKTTDQQEVTLRKEEVKVDRQKNRPQNPQDEV